MEIKQDLLNSYSTPFNLNLMRVFGIYPTIVLLDLILMEQVNRDLRNLDSSGYFPVTIEEMEKHTTLSRYKQDEAIKKLVNLKIVSQIIQNSPPKRNFKINYAIVDSILNS